MSAAMRGVRAVAGALLAGWVAAACATSPPLPTYTAPPGQGSLGELQIGTLTAGQGTACIQVKALRQRPVALVWPAGFTASYDPLRVYDAHGTEVASEGDVVTAGGVYVDRWSTTCQTAGYFEVIEIRRGDLSTEGP